MNEANLHELIRRYEDNLYMLNNKTNDEIFKWKSVKQFRGVWFSDDGKELPFSQMFNEARKGAAYILDNNRVSPTSGIVKMAEVYPTEIEALFRDVLFADDGGNISARQTNMDKFLAEIESIREKSFARCWKYKQDRHAASCYLAFVAPQDNYIYRYSEAEEFAQYIEFGKDIGSGKDFSLENYYEMCEIVVQALQQHDSLLEKHFKLIEGDEYYTDDSLHLLAFDLMYCCRCYNLYTGLEHATKKKSTEAFRLQELREKEAQERAERIAEIDSQIHALQVEIEPCKDISLIGVEVTQAKYGVGKIIEQHLNRITVQFTDGAKSFIIHRKFLARPSFEDEAEIVEAFSGMADKMDEIERLKNQRARYMRFL